MWDTTSLHIQAFMWERIEPTLLRDYDHNKLRDRHALKGQFNLAQGIALGDLQCV